MLVILRDLEPPFMTWHPQGLGRAFIAKQRFSIEEDVAILYKIELRAFPSNHFFGSRMVEDKFGEKVCHVGCASK